MSALLDAGAALPDEPRQLVPMTSLDVDAVLAIEAGVYAFPWTRGNFIDSLAAGYDARLLRVGAGWPLQGYFVAMTGVDEMHLLNITVAAACQRRGHARFMLAELVRRCRKLRLGRLWLEARESNAVARAAYRRLGFAEKGVRPGYYPAPRGQRETAVVMSLEIDAGEASG